MSPVAKKYFELHAPYREHLDYITQGIRKAGYSITELTALQYVVLEVISGNPGLTRMQLSELVGVPPQNLEFILKYLPKQGYVSQYKNGRKNGWSYETNELGEIILKDIRRYFKENQS